MHDVRRKSLSDLEVRVERLSATLLPPSLQYPKRERQALREGKAAIDKARAHLNEVARTVGNTSRFAERGRALPAELIAARDALDKAEQNAVKLRGEFVKAKETREREFLAAVGEQLAEAGPTLAELVRLLDRGFGPLVQLSQFATTHGLPMPRALAMAAELQEPLRRCTALVNALAPGQGDDED